MVLINYNQEQRILNKLSNKDNVFISNILNITDIKMSKRKILNMNVKFLYLLKLRRKYDFIIIPINYSFKYENDEKHRVCIIIDKENILYFDPNGVENSINKSQLFSIINDNIKDESLELNTTSNDCVLYSLGYIISKISNKNILKYKKQKIFEIINKIDYINI
jgi:hypothetical protein